MNTPTWNEQVLRAFSAAGLRLTAPRRTIVSYIAHYPNTFTAEQLVEHLPQVGRATIYRTLDTLLASHWLARVHRADGEHAYVAAEPHKHHLVCTRCSTSIPFETCDLDGLLAQLEQRTGFLVQGHALEAFGLCAACQSMSRSRPSFSP